MTMLSYRRFFPYAVASALTAYTTTSPVLAETRLEQLARESRQRQEQLQSGLHGIQSRDPTCGRALAQGPGTQGPVSTPQKMASPHTIPGTSSGASFEPFTLHNPTIEANIEVYRFTTPGGQILEYRRPYTVETGKLRGQVLYALPEKPAEGKVTVGLYGFMPALSKKVRNPSWALGPTIRTVTGGTNLQLDITKDELSLYASKDGYGFGPLNLKNPAAFQGQLHHALVYNLASAGVGAVAGDKARKTAQRMYAASQLIKSPTPAGLALSAFSEIRKHRKDKGGAIKKAFRIIGHWLTFGAFCRKR